MGVGGEWKCFCCESLFHQRSSTLFFLPPYRNKVPSSVGLTEKHVVERACHGGGSLGGGGCLAGGVAGGGDESGSEDGGGDGGSGDGGGDSGDAVCVGDGNGGGD